MLGNSFNNRIRQIIYNTSKALSPSVHAGDAIGVLEILRHKVILQSCELLGCIIVLAKHHPEFRERYRRLKARRGHKKAIIAICRMFLTAIWNVLSKAEPYSPAVFIGSGISGAAHFIVGMSKSKLIINVNRDENARIFNHSDYGVVGDAAKFMSALNELL